MTGLEKSLILCLAIMTLITILFIARIKVDKDEFRDQNKGKIEWCLKNNYDGLSWRNGEWHCTGGDTIVPDSITN